MKQDAMWSGATGDKYHHYGISLSVKKKLLSEQGRKDKREFVDAYGGCCYCCGETEIAFLTVEHLRDDGHLHRKKIANSKTNPGGGAIVINHLKKQGWPKDKGITVACNNCNMGREANIRLSKSRGYGSKHCPHGIHLRIVKMLDVG